MSETDGYVVRTSKIVDHGPDKDRWNLVILGDGYQANELTKYETDVQNFWTAFRTTPPFDELLDAINVHRVYVVSTERGADEPSDCKGGTGATKRTYFDATFCDTLLTVNASLTKSVAKTQVPDWRQVLVIVNSSRYGGSGDPHTNIATCSTDPRASHIAIHELGHSAFGLADEYDSNTSGSFGDNDHAPMAELPQPNVTLDTHATNKKTWKDLIAPTTPLPSDCHKGCKGSTCVPPATPPPPGVVGTYEGAYGSDCNIYRPFPDCYMRTLGSPFCPVCMDVIRQTLKSYLPLESIT